MQMNLDDVKAALSALQDPVAGVALGRAVKSLSLQDGRAQAVIELSYPAASADAQLRQAVEAFLLQQPGVNEVALTVQSKIVPHGVQRGLKPLPQVKNIIAIASGKGGVGKSTTCVNLALALAALGARVGILDADIYGPSQPMMTGIAGQPESRDGQSMEPMQNYGLQVASIGFLIKPEDAMVWRGPMVTQALQQLLLQTNWQDLDYLLVDMPPGTGDIQLTLSQKVPLTGAVIVTTPQDIALADALRGLKMFEKVGVPILGIIENMSMHICSNCGHHEAIFGEGGAQKMCQQHGIEFLGGLPLRRSIREQADAGKPSVIAEPDGDVAQIYRRLALQLAVKLGQQSKDMSSKFPNIVVKHD
ncbi:iron-sulfur cluster carrier protein ApbC [Massilia sp. W12]|uniref:iron-sulfur cluster carrier protein ApbC n=1 Tax=Massilia sp. W12 TaxID=3126507 RepID=UPI0030CF96A2